MPSGMEGSLNWLWPLGSVYILLGFLGAFVSETFWWRRRVRRGRLPIALRTLLFLVLVRGLMYVTPSRGWTALAAAAALALGSGLLWLDSRSYQRHVAAGGLKKGQKEADDPDAAAEAAAETWRESGNMLNLKGGGDKFGDGRRSKEGVAKGERP